MPSRRPHKVIETPCNVSKLQAYYTVMTTEKAKALQVDLLQVIRRYNEEGAAYDDIAKCVMHVAALVSITAEMSTEDVMTAFEFLYRLAKAESDILPIKN